MRVTTTRTNRHLLVFASAHDTLLSGGRSIGYLWEYSKESVSGPHTGVKIVNWTVIEK